MPGWISTRILGKTMRDAVRNRERWKRSRTPTQYPSTDLPGKWAPSYERCNTPPPAYAPARAWFCSKLVQKGCEHGMWNPLVDLGWKASPSSESCFAPAFAGPGQCVLCARTCARAHAHVFMRTYEWGSTAARVPVPDARYPEAACACASVFEPMCVHEVQYTDFILSGVRTVWNQLTVWGADSGSAIVNRQS